jgi:glutaredoxin 3
MLLNEGKEKNTMSAKVEIYTKDYCPYCTKAKMLLEQLRVAFTEIDISRNPQKQVEMLERKPGARTVPQIFINDAGIGGCDDLYALHSQNKLKPLLGL